MKSEIKDKEGNGPLSLNEFIWAFSIVSSRTLAFNNTAMADTTDPKAFISIVPLLDFINHSLEPNCIVVPFHDKVDN